MLNNYAFNPGFILTFVNIAPHKHKEKTTNLFFLKRKHMELEYNESNVKKTKVSCPRIPRHSGVASVACPRVSLHSGVASRKRVHVFPVIRAWRPERPSIRARVQPSYVPRKDLELQSAAVLVA